MSEVALVEHRTVSDRNEEQLVTMSVDGQLFGLPILSVQDIVETHNITQVPRTPSAISGIMNLRGRIVTVINLRRILGRNDDTTSRMGVTVEFHGDLYTILVDQIGEVRLLDRSDFESAPATLDSKLKQLCTGIYRLDGELLAVLDVNQILSAETISQTPPIKFIARRPKETKEIAKSGPKALPAPANDESDEAVSDDEPSADVAPKTGKNMFRKQKPASSAKSAVNDEDGDERHEPEHPKAVKPAAKPVEKAPSAASAKAKAAPVTLSKPKGPAPTAGAGAHASKGSAADVAPGAPASISRSENLVELVGGESALARIIKNFFDKVAADKRLGKHYEGADLHGQVSAMESFFSSALKGAGDGRNVHAPGHRWLSPKKGLDDEDFNRCLALFEKTMQEQTVPDGTIFRVLAVFERHRESIVD
jgi:chemotaxis signal transduction protein/truncated hemoglobin YjbI